MEVETTPATLDALTKLGAKVKYVPNIDLGQLLNLVPLILALIGGVAAYYGMTAILNDKISEVKTVNTLQDERISVIQRSASEQKQSLVDINLELKSVSNAVRDLSTDFRLATQQIQQGQRQIQERRQ